MATITDPALVTAVGERIRPHAELVYAMQRLGTDDLPVLTALLASVPDDATVLDGGGPSAFTGAHFHAYAGLLSDLLAGVNDPTVWACITAAVVRPLDTILAGLSAAGASDNTVSGVIAARIRPRCRVLRKLRYEFANNLNVLPALVAAYQSADVIDDGRAGERIAPLTVGQVQVLLAFMTGMTSAGVNTAARALAVDYGAGTPLVVNY